MVALSLFAAKAISVAHWARACGAGAARVRGVCVDPGSSAERALHLAGAVRQVVLRHRGPLSVTGLAAEIEAVVGPSFAAEVPSTE